jgi:subtilisin family serine protease
VTRTPIRVAVVDSGVHIGHPHIGGRIAGGVAIDDRGREHPGRDDYVDRLGHGTAVAAAILERAPAAELYAVRVFDRTLSTTMAGLVGGIDWAIRSGMHVVNLSLGTARPEHEAALSAVVARAKAANVIIVAARDAAGDDRRVRWLPGSLPDVLPVQLDADCPRDRYAAVDVDGVAVFRASGFPRAIDGVPPERNLNGISFAVANMTGFVARALESSPGATLAEIVRWLMANG